MIFISGDPSLCLYIDYVFKSRRIIYLGQVTKITNQSSRYKRNYMKQIMLQDKKVLLPCLMIEVTLYTRDGD